jgi:hypothetical protein
MKSVPPTVAATSDRAALDRIRHRRRANQFTVIACILAAGVAIALAVWIPTLVK